MEQFTHTAIQEHLTQSPESNQFISAIDAEIMAIRETLPKEITTPEGIFAATYLEASARIIRPLFADPNLKDSPLMAQIGGPDHNPHRGIDLIGGIIVDRVVAHLPELSYSKIRVEEIGKWVHVHRPENKKNKPQRYIIIDPCDMTSLVAEGKPVQTTGITIYDAKGTLLSGGIVSLTKNSQVFVERQHKTYTVIETHEHADTTEPKIAFLHRRLEEQKIAPKFIRDMPKNDLFPCVSGAAILGFEDGSVNLALDPDIGQPWYELVIWGKIAQILGASVTFPDGKPIDFAALVKWGATYDNENKPLRIPVLMAQTDAIKDAYLPYFRNNNEVPRYHSAARILDVFQSIAGLGPVPTAFIARLTGASIEHVKTMRQMNSTFCREVDKNFTMILPRANFVVGGTGLSVYPKNEQGASKPNRGQPKRAGKDHGTAAQIKHSGESH